jgi:hypothetical protein
MPLEQSWYLMPLHGHMIRPRSSQKEAEWAAQSYLSGR